MKSYTEDEVKELMDIQHKRLKLFLIFFMSISSLLGHIFGFIIGVMIKNH